MAKNRRRPKGKKAKVAIPCPRCEASITINWVEDSCYTGECKDCNIEIRAVFLKDNVPPTTELYSREIEIPPDDYDQWFS